MTASRNQTGELIELGDVDELLRQVDRLCGDRDWEGLLELRDRSRRAIERGRQLWPVASHAEYRLALEAPGEWAAGVLVGGTGRFALGPLPEVAASTHTWAELADHLEPGPLAAVFAQERVVRGEDLARGDVAARVGVALEVPLALAGWEPPYPLATYKPDGAEFPAPAPPAFDRVTLLADEPEVIGDPDATRSLEDVVTTWIVESNGSAEAVCVEGDHGAAIRALGPRAAFVTEVPREVAVAHLAWAGASGGAHGRRRGMAAGRFAAWWSLAAIAGVLEQWPVSGDELDGMTKHLRWYLWQPDEPVVGWTLRLAVEDSDEELAWAVNASDHD